MTGLIRVLVLEDDPYARDMICLLLRRDWRTCVVAEIEHPSQLRKAIKTKKPHVIVADLDMPAHSNWLSSLFRKLENIENKPKLLCLSLVSPELHSSSIKPDLINGYLIKQEIHYSLAWAVVDLMAGNWVCTLGSEIWSAKAASISKTPVLVMQGAENILGLTPRQTEIAMLGILYNLSRRDLADELQRSEHLIYKYVHLAYKELGIENDSEHIEQLFKEDELVLSHIRKALSTDRDSLRKIRDKDTIAFHILTSPFYH